jgi:alkaline phosphatase D
MYAPVEAKCVVEYWREAAPDQVMSDQFMAFTEPVSKGTGHPVRVVLDGLQADTAYGFKVLVMGKSDPAWVGSFRTAPVAGTPSAFRLALTSCMKIGQPQASWYLLLAQQPDLHLTLGDTHYADTTDPAVQLESHVRYRREPYVATVHRQLPTYSIWDDHDYGPNDSDGTAVGKEESLKGWKQFWVNPGAGTPGVPGAFYKFTRGEVEFFVVDGRYHRSPDKAPDDDRKRMLGDAQFEWLMNGLKNSTAKFKVIASGSTLEQSKGDGWKIYTFSRHRLLDGIRENKVSGVMYMSGDIHSSKVREHQESDRVGYPFLEVISSGIANSQTLSFATIDFDTTMKDPTVRVRIIHGDGTVRDDRTWRLSQLGGR